METSQSIPVFYHIPKTAGMSMRDILKQEYVGNRGYTVVNNFSFTDSNGNPRCFYGHKAAYSAFCTDKMCVYFTLFRDPISRIISHFSFMKQDWVQKICGDLHFSINEVLETRFINRVINIKIIY